MAQYVVLTQKQRRTRVDDMYAEALERTEKRLGLPSRYILQLRTDGGDWEFIIKLAVLVEAAVTQALVSSLHNEKMFDHISGLSQSSRLRLCDTLGLLKKEERLVLETLATTRNQFAHRVENLGRSLEAYAEALTLQQKVEAGNRLLVLEGDDRLKESENFGWLCKGFRRILLEAVILPLTALSAKDAEAELDSERRAKLERRSYGLAAMFDEPARGSN